MKRIVLYLIVLVLCCTLAADAHETYVRPISGWANLGDAAFLLLGSGHFTASTELPEGIVNVTVIEPSGDLILDDRGAIDGFWNVYSFEADEPGLYVVDIYHSEGAWTHFITNPPTEDFWEHKYVEEIDFDSLNTTGWADDWYVERSYPKNCFAKAFIAAPDADFSIASQPIGQDLEIVPLDNITTVGNGDFQFQVFYMNEPFPGIDVWAVRVGDDSNVVEGVTDDDGKVTLNLTDSSELSEWVVRTDSKMDPRIVKAANLPRGEASTEKSYVGPVYRSTLTLRSDYIMED